MRTLKKVGMTAAIGVMFGSGWWFYGGLKTVRIVPATSAQIDASVPPSLVYHPPATANEDNPWRRLDRLFSLPLGKSCPNYSPPLSDRSLPAVRQYLDQSEWVEANLDGILEDASKLPSQAHTPRDASGLPGVNESWRYSGLRLAYEQREGNPSRIWRALRRLLLLSRMSVRVEGPGPILSEVANVWTWPQNLQVGLAEPSLSTSQLQECLRLLPTDDELLASAKHSLQLEYSRTILAKVQPAALREFERDYSRSEDVRRFYCGELDVLRTVRDTSDLVTLKLSLLHEPFPVASLKISTSVRNKFGVYPEFPWPAKNENFMQTWWRNQVYRIGMRATQNSMLRFLNNASYTSTGLDILAHYRSLVLLARLHVSLRLYEKRFGRLPSKLKQLVSSGLLKSLPRDPFSGGEFSYNGRSIQSIGADQRWGTPDPTKVANDDITWPLVVHPRS